MTIDTFQNVFMFSNYNVIKGIFTNYKNFNVSEKDEIRNSSHSILPFPGRSPCRNPGN